MAGGLSMLADDSGLSASPEVEIDEPDLAPADIISTALNSVAGPSPLAQMSQDPVNAGILRLELQSRSAGGDRFIDQFRSSALAMLPKAEELERARQARREAAMRYIAGAGEVHSDPGLPWLMAASGFLRPTKTGAFGESLGYGIEGYSTALADRQKAVRDALARKNQAQYQVSLADEAALEKQQLQGINAAKAVATLDRLTAMLGNKTPAMSDLEKRTRAMLNLPPGTALPPEGVKLMKKLNFVQNGTPEVKAVIAANPDLDVDSPDFAKLVQRQLDLKEENVTSRISAANAGAERSAATVARLEHQLEEERQRGKSLGPNPELAAQFGVPLSPVNPYAKLSGAAAERLFANNEKAFATEIGKINEDAAKAESFGRDARRSLELLETGMTTGGVYKLPGAAAVGTSISPEAGEFEAIAKRIAPQLRVAGSGAMSDFDVKMLLASSLGLDKRPEVNKNIAMGYIAAEKQIKEYRDLKQRYFDANGHAKGFDELWSKYKSEQPILDRSSREGDIVLAKDRPSFTEWAKKKGLIK